MLPLTYSLVNPQFHILLKNGGKRKEKAASGGFFYYFFGRISLLPPM